MSVRNVDTRPMRRSIIERRDATKVTVAWPNSRNRMNATSVIGVMSIIAVSLASCQSSETSVSPQPRASLNPAHWVPAMTPDDATALSPDEAKAILLARSVVEENAKRAGQPAPEILHFYPKATEDGWDVHVEYLAFWHNGEPSSAAGFFTEVLIGRNWKIIRVIGGA